MTEEKKHFFNTKPHSQTYTNIYEERFFKLMRLIKIERMLKNAIITNTKK